MKVLKNEPIDTKQLELEKIINDLKNKLLSPNDKYISLDKALTDLSVLKQAKLSQLEQLCADSITNGFDSDVNSVSYRFSCSLSAQANFQGADELFKDGLITESEWTVINNTTGKVERIILSKEVFNSIKPLVFQHINENISRLRNMLEPQVDSAATNEEVDAVVW